VALLIGLTVVATSYGATAQNKNSSPEDVIAALPWEHGGSHKLPLSHSTLTIPGDHIIVTMHDAATFEDTIGNGQLNGLEAVTVSGDDYQQVILQSVNEGYVSIDDWKDVDATALLQSVKESTEAANQERQKSGFSPMHVIGWLQQPTLDPSTNTVYWAFGATEGEDSVVNARAVRLGRNGFELLTWVGSSAAYRTIGGDLDLALRSFSFDPGYRYADHSSNDHIAAYTIAALVAGLAGAKVAKVAAVGGLLLLIKKLGVFVVVAAGALLAKFRGIFRRKRA